MPARLTAIALLLALAAPAGAETPATLKLGDTQLTLNGRGSRTKYLMQMYEAGLYLAEPSADAKAIIAADAPMAIRIEVTSGLVTQEKLVESLNEGFASATGGKVEPLAKEIGEFRKCFAAPIAKGDVFNLVYLPPHGLIVLKNGKKQGAVAGLAFKQTVFAIWLGDRPADEKLKLALLAK
jgi:hypothetical protein